MPDKNSKFDQEIDAGKFFTSIFLTFLAIGAIAFFIWFLINVYNIKERAYIDGSRYAYSVIQKELIDFYKTHNHIFDENNKNDEEFCRFLINKHASNRTGNCQSFNPNFPVENFTFKGKKMSIYGLEKPLFYEGDRPVKDIIIDVNGESKGENLVGVDRTILRIYSSGDISIMLTPVNCSDEDDKEYAMKKSLYCAGSEPVNYLALNKPLGFDIQQIASDNGKTRKVGNDLSFLRADCTAFGGDLLGHDDYCEDRKLYWLRGCYDEYICNISLSK